MVLQLLLLLALVCLLYYCFTRTFGHWKHKNVKGPKPIPFFGNFKNVALRKQHMGMFYNEFYKQYPNEKVVGLYRMTSPTLLIRDLDIVKQILVKDFESFPDRGTYFSEEGLGQNIFHADAETWPLLRNRLSSVFTPTKFKCTFHLVAERADKLANYIEDLIKDQPEQDIYQLILKHTVGITMITVFGLDIDMENNNGRAFEVFDEHLKTSFLNELDMLFPGCLRKFNLSILSDVAIKFAHEIIQAGIRHQLTGKYELSNVMDVLLNMRKEGDIHVAKFNKINNNLPFLKVTDDLLAGQAWASYAAGYANNTLALTYAMYHLARNPDVQEKLIQEIDKVLDKYDGKLTYEALKEMKYLGMIFEETLRLHPLTNAIVRSVSRDTKLEGTDMIINKDSIVAICPYAIQRDEKHYPEPERFNPDRFLPENIADRNTFAFLSFGSGQRSCLGTQLARIQFGVCATKIFAKFRVETTKNTISNITYNPYRLLLTPKQRIILKFVPRNK